MVIESYVNLVNALSYEFSRKFRMVEVDDIRQEMWLWFVEHPNKVKYWEENYDNKECTKLIARSLRNAAKDFCQREKAVKLGYRVEDLYYYDRELIELLLPATLTGELTAPALADLGYTKNKTVLSEGNNWLTMCSDIDAAFESLQKDQQNILFLRYANGLEPVQLSHELSISVDAVRMRINRAMKTLLTVLGGDKPKRERDYRRNHEHDSNASDGEFNQDSLESGGRQED